MFDFLKNLFMPGRKSLGLERWNRFKRKRKVGHKEGIVKTGFFGKAAYRCYMRAKSRRVVPVEPTGKAVMSRDKRKQYRIWSDGSLRLMKAGKRRLIPV